MQIKFIELKNFPRWISRGGGGDGGVQSFMLFFFALIVVGMKEKMINYGLRKKIRKRIIWILNFCVLLCGAAEVI